VSIEGQLRDQCLEMRLRHTYENDKDSPLECVFRFEALPSSVLCGLEVVLADGKRIVGKVKEKTKAAAKYGAAQLFPNYFYRTTFLSAFIE
jgi:hypothetical protein